MSASITIRDERPGDVNAIRAVNLAAFGQALEGRIVDALRSNRGVLLSLVAEIDGRIVGHILYSPVILERPDGEIVGAGLGPMAVRPEHQRRGIGGKLIELGRRRLEEKRCPFVVVLGHPEYYPRFGFEPAAGRAIRCPWDVPDDAFMVLILDPSRMSGVSGLARYRPEFSDDA